VILVRRLDWMEMMRRFERLSRFCNGVSFFSCKVCRVIIADLHFGDLVFPKPEFFQRGQCFQVFDFLNGPRVSFSTYRLYGRIT
jgi:hypothetical protein